jgi:hypothetical protein
MGFFKYVNFPVFILSLIIGLYAVYITLPDSRKIFVYPTPENVDKILFKDKAENCFRFEEEIIECPKDESLISNIPMQT